MPSDGVKDSPGKANRANWTEAMTLEILMTLGILAVAVALFVAERWPLGASACFILALLLVSRLVTPEEGVSGFSHAATVTVAAMFILSEGLRKTGALNSIGRLLLQKGNSQFKLLLAVLLIGSVCSAFINNTAIVAVFIPLVVMAANKHQFSASKFLIPLSFAAQFGGICTLMGTSTNILVSTISNEAGHGRFSLFEFTKLGCIMAAAGIVYFLSVGRRLLPSRQTNHDDNEYKTGDYVAEVRVLQKSPLIGTRVKEIDWFEKHKVRLLEALRGRLQRRIPSSEPIEENDKLLIRGGAKELMELKTAAWLDFETEVENKKNARPAAHLLSVEALVPQVSSLIGETVADVGFQRRFGASVLGVQRHSRPARRNLENTRIQFGDVLLLLGNRENIERLRSDENLVLLSEIAEPAWRRHKAPLALAIMASVVAMAFLNVFPIMVSALIGGVLMILTRCLTFDEAYHAVDWSIIFLLAGLIPLGLAMEKTGAALYLADHVLGIADLWGPTGMLGGVYLLAAILTAFVSNNATAVLLAPIAINVAVKLGLSPKPFLMAVTFAASTSFTTPIGYQTNAMIYGVGGYRFVDFVKVGLPLELLFFGLAIVFLPIFWPF